MTSPRVFRRVQRDQPTTSTPVPTVSTGTVAALGAASLRGRATGHRSLLALHREARGLCALQLVARGYSTAQVAALRGVPAPEVARDLRGAVRALGAASIGEAIHVAMRRGLLL